MNKKIASEFAIGIILLVAIIVSGIFWLQRMKPAGVSQALLTKQAGNACKPHYYEGEARIQGWISPEDKNSGNEVIVQVREEDMKNLPITDPDSIANFTVKLVDPTDAVRNSLRLATKEKPASVVVRGFAEICQQPPLVSLQQAKIAFKKS